MFGDGSISFSVSPDSECDKLNFLNTSVNHIPGTLNWSFGDPDSGLSNNSDEENPTHIFTEPGWYTIILIGQVPAPTEPSGICTFLDYQDVIIPLVAGFGNGANCINQPIGFTSATLYLPGEMPDSWSWDFGDPSSGADNFSNLPNPSHSYASAGNYTVTLTVTNPNSGCQSIATGIAVVYPEPLIDFEIPSFSCENKTLFVEAIISPDVIDLNWDFGDPDSGNANFSENPQTAHVFEAVGDYLITLSATTIQGCESTITKMITIEESGGSGEITAAPESPICEGDSLVLTAPDWGEIFIWSTGDTAQSITVQDAGIYTGIAFDEFGCGYTPPAYVVDIIPAPSGTIRAG